MIGSLSFRNRTESGVYIKASNASDKGIYAILGIQSRLQIAEVMRDSVMFLDLLSLREPRELRGPLSFGRSPEVVRLLKVAAPLKVNKSSARTAVLFAEQDWAREEHKP